MRKRWLVGLIGLLAACGGSEKMSMESTVCCTTKTPVAGATCEVVAGSEGAAACSAMPDGQVRTSFVVDASGPVTATATVNSVFSGPLDPIPSSSGACIVMNSGNGYDTVCMLVQITTADGSSVGLPQPAIIWVTGAPDAPPLHPFEALSCVPGIPCTLLERGPVSSTGDGASLQSFGPIVVYPGLAVQIPQSTPAIGEVGACGLGASLLAVALWKLPARARRLAVRGS